MKALNISLPDSIGDFVDQEINDGGYTSVSDYFGDLLRDQRLRRAQEKFDALILAGLQSGPGIEATPEYWAAMRAAFLAGRQTPQSAE